MIINILHHNKSNDVANYFSNNTHAIRQQKFYLLIDSSTMLDKTVSVIKALNDNKIDNYKVINYQAYFQRPDSTSIPEPIITTSNKTYDSTYFSINITDNRFKLKIQNKDVEVNTDSELDQFIRLNKALILSDKIQIILGVNTPVENFNRVSEVLSNHGYNRFNLITK